MSKLTVLNSLEGLHSSLTIVWKTKKRFKEWSKVSEISKILLIRTDPEVITHDSHRMVKASVYIINKDLSIQSLQYLDHFQEIDKKIIVILSF